MKKYLVHAIYLVVIAFVILYAYIKATEAERISVIATENRERAERQEELAAREAARAVEAQAEAERNAAEAVRLVNELEACKSAKK